MKHQMTRRLDALSRNCNDRKDWFYVAVDPDWEDSERDEYVRQLREREGIPDDANVSFNEWAPDVGRFIYVPDFDEVLRQIANDGKRVGDTPPDHKQPSLGIDPENEKSENAHQQ